MENDKLSEYVTARLSPYHKKVVTDLQAENDCTISVLFQVLCERLATNKIQIYREEINAQKAAYKAWSHKKK